LHDGRVGRTVTQSRQVFSPSQSLLVSLSGRMSTCDSKLCAAKMRRSRGVSSAAVPRAVPRSPEKRSRRDMEAGDYGASGARGPRMRGGRRFDRSQSARPVVFVRTSAHGTRHHPVWRARAALRGSTLPAMCRQRRGRSRPAARGRRRGGRQLLGARPGAVTRRTAEAHPTRAAPGGPVRRGVQLPAVAPPRGHARVLG
jgi:hypothetical protein